MGALPVDRPEAYYTPIPPRVERHSASRGLFVCSRPAPELLQGCLALRSPEPRQQTHFRSLGCSLGAPRLSSPWRVPPEESSFAITTDALMNTDQIESVASKEECYLLELVRYLHLNPLRAKVVPDLRALDRYPWTGHSALLGTVARPWQTTRDILTQFGARVARARRAYRDFAAAGVEAPHWK